MTIHAITNTEDYPWELLLLADPERDIVASYLEKSEVFVYQEDEDVIGVMVIQQGEHIEIMNLAVAENAQGRGIGRQLLTHALAYLKQAEPTAVIIKTGDISGPALGLYQSLGFVIKETVENYFIEHYPEPIFEEGQQLKHQVILEKII